MPARMIGVLLGLSALLGAWSLSGPAPARVPGRILPDCDGAATRLVVQYVDGATFAAAVYRRFLPLLPAGREVSVVCPSQQAWQEFQSAVGAVRCTLRPVIVGHAMTAWSRDRWIARRDADGGITLLPGMGETASDTWPARAGDGRLADDLARLDGSAVRCSRSRLFYDGGDFVADAETVFVAPGAIRRNLQHTVASLDELRLELQRLTGRRVVLLENAPEHHAGMFLMPVGHRTALVGDPSLAGPTPSGAIPGGVDRSPQTQARFDAVAETVRQAGYRVVRLPLVPSLDGRTYVTFLNVLIDAEGGQRVVYMPVFDGFEALGERAAAIWRSLGYEVRPVDCSEAYVHFGSLRCLVNVMDRQ